MKTKLINKINISKNTSEKWSMIIDKIETDLDENVLNKICDILDNHANMENIHKSSIDFQGKRSESNLPAVLNVLTKLNLNNKNILITDLPMNKVLMSNGEIKNITRIGEITSTFKTTRSYVEDLGDILLETVQSKLIDSISNQINEKLKYYDTIIIYNVFSFIETISEKTMSPIYFGRSRIGFLDRNDVKEPFYNIEFEGENIIKAEVSNEKYTHSRKDLEEQLELFNDRKLKIDNSIKLIEETLI